MRLHLINPINHQNITLFLSSRKHITFFLKKTIVLLSALIFVLRDFTLESCRSLFPDLSLSLCFLFFQTWYQNLVADIELILNGWCICYGCWICYELVFSIFLGQITDPLSIHQCSLKNPENQVISSHVLGLFSCSFRFLLVFILTISVHITTWKSTETGVNRTDIPVNRRDRFSDLVDGFGEWNQENRLIGAVVGSGLKTAPFKPSPALTELVNDKNTWYFTYITLLKYL
jgi:hypothetical protein